MGLFAKKTNIKIAASEEEMPTVKTMKQLKKELSDKHPLPDSTVVDRIKRIFGSLFIKQA